MRLQNLSKANPNHFCNELSLIACEGFSAVKYRSGSYFNRSTTKTNPGYQIDLTFDRDDNVITICEIKYNRGKVPFKVIQEFEKKLQLFPNSSNKTIQKTLISAFGAEQSVRNSGYFDTILTLDDFF